MHIASYALSRFPHKQLGTGDTSSRAFPIIVSGLPLGALVTGIACGASHTAVLLDTGAVYAWVRIVLIFVLLGLVEAALNLCASLGD